MWLFAPAHGRSALGCELVRVGECADGGAFDGADDACAAVAALSELAGSAASLALVLAAAGSAQRHDGSGGTKPLFQWLQ
jgi:hypothetical protein